MNLFLNDEEIEELKVLISHALYENDFQIRNCYYFDDDLSKKYELKNEIYLSIYLKLKNKE